MKNKLTNRNVLHGILLTFFMATFFNYATSGQTTTFGYTGSVQYFTVPGGVTSVSVDMQGAIGGYNSNYPSGSYSSFGGYGGRVTCVLAVTPGAVMQIFVGGGGGNGVGGVGGLAGFNDSGANGGEGYSTYSGGGGGGASDIRIAPYGLTNRVVVAGGGGGAGINYPGTNKEQGGSGGGLIGENGFSDGSTTNYNGGQGGTQSAGGASGMGAGYAGELGYGGPSFSTFGCGGGGGGYYGGGSGGTTWAGGGGGSSYTDGTLCSSVAHTQGYNTVGPNGSVKITMPCTSMPIAGNTTLSTAITTTLSNTSGGGTWTSSNTGIATIGSSTGIVNGVSAGNAVITYLIPGGCMATTTVTVNTPKSCINTDGASSYVAVPNSLSASDITIEYWMKTTSTGRTGNNWYLGSGIVDAEVPYVYNDFGTSLNGSKLCFGIGNPDTSIFSVSDVNTGNWVHVAATWSHTTGQMNLYINGVLENSITGSSTNFRDAPSRITIGMTQTAVAYYSGNIDEVRLWSEVRTQSQILADMDCDIPQQSGLVGYYRFDEGVAGGTNTSLTTTPDYSGNNNCGTLNNFALTGSTNNYETGAMGDCSSISVAGPSAITGTTTLLTAFTSTLSDSLGGGVWSSGNTVVATVGSGTGIVTGVSAGTATITYTLNCKSATKVVTVYNPRAGMNFDGVNDYVSTGSGILNLSTASFTIEAWVKTTGVSMGIVNKQDNTSTWDCGGKCFYIDASGNPGFVGEADHYILSSTPVNDGNWHHVAVSWNYVSGTSGTGHIYVDGVERTTLSNYDSYYCGDNGNINIGNTNYNVEAPNTFSGSMDEVRIWNVARTQSQIQANMNCTVPRQTGLVAYFRFDEGTAAGTNTGIQNAIDYSGNFYCGQLNNFALTGSSSNYVTGCLGDCSPIIMNLPGAITGTTTFITGNTTTLTDSVTGGVWSSSNTAVATVGSASGVVTGISAGTATISYSLNCQSATILVNVSNPRSGINFDGVNDYISTESGILNLSTASFTIEAWVKTTGVSMGIVNKQDHTNTWDCGGKCFYIDASGNPGFVGEADDYILSSTPVNDGNWHHVAVSWNYVGGTSGTGHIYVDGVERTTLSNYYSYYCGDNGNINIGNTNYNGTYGEAPNTFSGSMDEVRIWNVARTQSQIQANMNCTVPRQSNLMAYYRFDEGTAGGTNTGFINAFDYSGNNYCGQLNNFALTGTSSNYVTGAIGDCNPISTTLPGTISGTLNVCAGANTTLTNSVSGGVWSSGNTAVGTVGATTGIVTGISQGTVIITYTLNCGTATVIVTVNPVTSPITGTTTICQGTNVTLANANPGGTWSSSNTAVATVGTSGIVTGVSGGMAIITYSVSCGYSIIPVTINPGPGAITGSSSLCLGTTSTLTNASPGGIWSSSAPGTISVGSATGIITALGLGTATINYSTGCGSPATSVESSINAPASITGAATICPGSTDTLKNATLGGVWTSGTPGVAVVDINGVVTGLSGGTALISYSIACGTTTTVVTVRPALPAISGNSVCLGSSATLHDATSGGVWTSSTPSIATISSSSGVTNGVAVGTSVITYTASGCSTSTVLVVNPVLPVTGPTTVCAGTTINLNDSIAGGLWTSSNTAIATVNCNLGIINGISAGTSVISYTLPTGCTSTYTITVISLSPSVGSATLCTGASTTIANSTPGGVWSCNNTALASVGSSTGIVSGIAPGNVVINYAVGNGCNVSSGITVLTLTPNTVNPGVCIGSTTTISNVTVGGTWSSSNTAAATIGVATGVITGVSSGSSIITYTFGTTCQTTSTVNVNPDPSTVTVSGGGTSCGSATLTATGGTGGIIYFQGITAGGTSTTIPSTSTVINASGTYHFRSQSAAGCWSPDASTTALIPSISGPSTLCTGSTTTLSNTGGAGTWSSSAPAVATIGSSTGLLTALSAGSTVITSTLSSGCVVTTTLSVGTAPAITGSNIVCVGQTISLSTSGSGGTWSSGSPTVATVGSTGIVNGLASAHSATITYSYTSTCRATFTVSVNALSPVISPATGCVGQTITATDATTGGIWSSSVPGIATIGSNGIVTGISSGTAVISYTLSTGCIATAPVYFKVLTGSTGPQVVCAGQSITLSNTTPGGTWSTSSPTIVTVNSGNGIITGVAGISVTLSAPVSYTLGSGCIAVYTVSVNPSLPIGGATSVCQGLTTTLTNTRTGGTWSSASPSIATIGSTGILTGVGSGIVTISYLLPTGCLTTSEVYVNPVAPITGPTMVCQGQNITLYDAAGAGSWSSGATTIATVGSTTGIVHGIAPNLTVPITYTFCTGCRSIVTVSVAPLSAIAGSSSVCQGQVITLTDATSGGAWTSSNTAVAQFASTNGNVTGIAQGIATITYTLANGCASVTTVTVNPLSTIIGASALCISKTITLTNATPGGLWSSSAPSVASVVSVNGLVTGVAGNLSATISYTTSAGCKATKSVSVVALPTAPAAIGGPSTVSVSGSPITVTDATTGGTWSSGNTARATVVSGTGLVTGVSAGTVNITYTVTNGTGCTNYVSKKITVGPVPPPHSVTTNSISINVSADAVLNVPSEGGEWNCNDCSGIVGLDETTHTIMGTAPGHATITYSMTDNDGIRLIITEVTVNAAPEVVMPVVEKTSDLSLVPNPNKGDFTVKGTLNLSADEEVTLEVTDMLGQLVYKSIARTQSGKISERIILHNSLANGMYILNLRSSNENKVFHFAIEQ